MSWKIFIVKKEYCKYRYEDLHSQFSYLTKSTMQTLFFCGKFEMTIFFKDNN